MKARRATAINGPKTGLVALAALALASCTSGSISTSDIGKTRQTALGPVLVDADGNTLYTYDADSLGTSTCTGACAVVWPPVEAEPTAQQTESFTIITRPSGTRQWAYKGKPLYGYMFDNGPGSVSGDGEDGVWHVAKP